MNQEAGLPRRLRKLPQQEWQSCTVFVADSFVSRLLGLAWLRKLPDNRGLLLTNTCSVHTIGMRFALDLIWLDATARLIRVDHDVKPFRFRSCRKATQVIELISVER